MDTINCIQMNVSIITLTLTRILLYLTTCNVYLVAAAIYIQNHRLLLAAGRNLNALSFNPSVNSGKSCIYMNHDSADQIPPCPILA